MRWILFVTIAVLVAVLVRAQHQEEEPSAKTKRSPNSKTLFARAFLIGKGRKRGVPTYAHGYDIPVVRHSILKPFVVKYPSQSAPVPLGVKIPVRPPANPGWRTPVRPTHVNPGWPMKCAPSSPPVTAVLKPVAPAPLPVIPTTTTAAVAPGLTPILPLPQPPVHFITHQITKPIVPFLPAPLPVPVAPAPVPIVPTHVPVAPAHLPILPPAVASPIPSILRPGNSLHTSYFATFPKHPLITKIPAPIHPFAPIHPAAPIHPIAPIHPVAPLHIPHPHLHVSHPPLNLGAIPLHKFPLNVLHQLPAVQKLIPTNAIAPFPFQVTHSNVPLAPGELPGSIQTPQSLIPEDQFNNNFHGGHQFGGDSSPFTPMANPTQLPSSQFTQAYFTPENNQESYPEQGYNYNHFSSNPQHEPQLPQAFPQHPLSENQIGEEYHNHIPLRQHLPLSEPVENFSGYP